MSRHQGIDARRRQKEWDRKQRERRAAPPGAGTAESRPVASVDLRSWPIVRANVPIEDSFRVSGFGSAGIVRARPDGKWITAYFNFSLLDQGIEVMCGKDETDESENAAFLTLFGINAPALEPGPPELAARYIWGALALGSAAGFDFDPKTSARYLGMVPQIGGGRNWWLQQFTGPQGLAAPGLVRFLKDHPVPDGIPEDKEIAIGTIATFSCDDAHSICAKLEQRHPEFTDDGEKAGVRYFSWTRAYPKKHWSPFSKLGGRQVIGSVEVHADHLVAESKVLSMASKLITILKLVFGNDIKLTDTQWKGAEELIREAKEAAQQNEAIQ